MGRKAASVIDNRKRIEDGLAVLRSFAGRTKTAELGGQGNDKSFQEAFSNVAHAYIQDKAPALMPHELGFQLLDRNQDNTRSAGVFGFEIGSQKLFVPVFFLNGQLRGHELLYLQNQDMFVPLKENWVDEVMSRKPMTLGKQVSRDPMAQGLIQPQLNKMVFPPNKRAAAPKPTLTPEQQKVLARFAEWSHPFVLKAASVVRPQFKEAAPAAFNLISRLRDIVSLPKFLKQASRSANKLFLKWCMEYPAIAAAVDRHHGMDTIEAAIKEAAARVTYVGIEDMPLPTMRHHGGRYIDSPRDPIKSGALRIVYKDSLYGEAPKDLTPEEKEKLLLDSFVVQDSREDDDVSIPVKLDYGTNLTNPSSTGVYQVLTKGSEFEDCFVAHTPAAPDLKAAFVLVIKKNSPHSWVTSRPDRVWVIENEEGAAAKHSPEFKKWFDGLPDGSLSAGGDGVYTLVGPTGETVVPFSVRRSLGKDENGVASYEVRYAYSCRYGLNSLVSQDQYFSHEMIGYDDRLHPEDGTRIHLDAKRGVELRVGRGDIYVPVGFKVLKLSDPDTSYDEPGLEASETPLILGGDLMSQGMFAQTKKIKNESKQANAGVAAQQLMQNPGLQSELTEVIRQYIDDPNPGLSPSAPSAGDGQPTPPPPPPGDPAAMGGMPPGMDPAAMGGAPPPGAPPGAPPPGGPPPGAPADPAMAAMGGAPMPDPMAAQTSPKMAFALGDPQELQKDYARSFTELKIHDDGHEVWINKGSPLKHAAAVVSLIRDHGFREDAARGLMKLAAAHRTFRCRVKYAGPYLDNPPTAPFPNQPPRNADNMMGFNGPSVTTDVDEQVVPGMQSANYDQSGYDLKQAPPAWERQSGGKDQPEGFDTAMIGSMLRAVGDGPTIDRYLPPLFQGMDACGRLYLMFCWHGDQFADRFGKQDMPELEDSLRNTFENIGDLVLFLKHKSAQPFDDQFGRGFSLNDVA